MTDTAEISRRVYAAYYADDADEFYRLLIANPEFLRHANGTDRWMWQAASEGKLSIINALARLGVDVNEPKDVLDPDDPFCQVEGGIVQAASEGHLEVVRWFLAHGAQINSVVNGKPRCLPVQFAATGGHLEVVKLLVESGADWRASWNGHTPLSQAIAYGHNAVQEYLQSLDPPTP